MKNNIDEDIKKNVINKLEEIRVCGDKAELWNFEAGRTLTLIKKQDKELETYKKIAEKLAEVVDLGYMPFECSPMCIHDNCIKECTLDWARKEVEND